MNIPNVTTEITQLASGEHCVTIQIDASFVQSEALLRLNKVSKDDDTTQAETTNEILNDLIRSAFEEASLANKLAPASAPVIEFISQDNPGKYVFTATFEVVPSVEITGLSDIDIKIPHVEVTDNDIESTIEAILKRSTNREAALESLGIKEADMDKFKNEVLLNLQREAELYENEIKKHTVMTCVCDKFNIALPESMIKPEIEKLASTQIESNSPPLPSSELRIKATRNIQRRIIINAVVQKTHLSLHPHIVRQRVEKLATAYEDPEEAVQWYYSNRIELAGVEAKVIEGLVIDWIVNECNRSSFTISFAEASTMLSQLQ